MERRLFCFGCGYSAQALARRLLAQGWSVAGTSRSEAGAEALRAAGIAPVLFDPDHPLSDPEAALAGVTHVLLSVPPGAEGDPVLRRHGADLTNLQGLDWLGYLSTTGVYGDRQGGWVDEDSALQPTGSRGERRVAAEQGWLALAAAHGLTLQIFRLAGIYGPGRNALETVRAGKAKRLDKPDQIFSRIHVEDIATVLEAAIQGRGSNSVFNVCDDEAAPPQEVIAYACELLGVEAPPLIPFEQAALSEMARSFYRDNKRVSNQRLKDELGVTLAYPNYRAGLRALLAELVE